METKILNNSENETKILNGGTQILNNGTQVLNGGTQILNNGGTQILNGGTQVLNNGTQVLNGGTQVLNNGTQVLNNGTQVLNNHDEQNVSFNNFTGGLLQIDESISGWKIESKINVKSGEADLYISNKDGKKGVIKYYRQNMHPKQELLDKLLCLNHPDIINIYEYGTYKEHFYEIMEYAAGGSLDTRNDDGSYKLLPLPEEKVFQICKEVVNSFNTIHEKGIIHRDIKPANIYFRDEEQTDVVIGDFGISSLMVEQGEAVSHKTQTGSRTTGYAAPEVLSGIITPKMDYYALGITLWELATGQNPFLLKDGKMRNEQHLLRDTIEGRIVDDLLSREPFVSEKLQHMIRGLLVVDDKKRWGYDEVTRYLNGEDVEVAVKDVRLWEFTIGDIVCNSLEELGVAIANNIEVAKKYIYRGLLSGFLEEYYPDLVAKMDNIIEESSANNDLNNGILRIVWLLKPDYPFTTKNHHTANNIDDLIDLLIKHTNEMVPYIQNESSEFYTYLDYLGYSDKIEEITSIAKETVNQNGFSLKQSVYWIAIILKDKKIKPFKENKYKDFELIELDQIFTLPLELRQDVLNAIKSKSFDGFLFPWLTLLASKNTNWNKIKTWNDIAQIHINGTYYIVSLEGDSDYTSLSDAVDEAPEGSTIELKKGTYSNNLSINKELKIIAEDNNVVISLCTWEINKPVTISNIQFDNGYEKINESQITDSYINANAPVHIENCEFKNTNGTGLLASKGSNVVIEKCIFTNCYSALCNYDSTYINESKFYNNFTGIDNNNFGTLTVKQCMLYDNKFAGLNIAGNSKTYVLNTEMYRNENGISSSQEALLNIDDCKIYQNNNGFDVHGSSKVECSNSKIIKNNYTGFMCYENSTSVIKQCMISDSGTSNIFAWDYAKLDITNSNVSNSLYCNIELKETSDSKIENTTISNSNLYGLYIHDSAKISATKCTIENNKKYGILYKNKSILNKNDFILQNNVAVKENKK